MTGATGTDDCQSPSHGYAESAIAEHFGISRSVLGAVHLVGLLCRRVGASKQARSTGDRSSVHLFPSRVSTRVTYGATHRFWNGAV
jgi:hypothetical protein